MPRYALRLEYDGAPFCGWQRQNGQLSIQLVLEEAAAHLNGGEVPHVTAAGRTDAGVHAEAQVAHLDLATDLPPERVREALNFHTRPHPLAVTGAAIVAPDWSARFSAIGRAYRYRILNRPARPALEWGRVWHVKKRLDAAAMHEAAQGLLGRHDFSAYRAASCQAKSPLRTLDRLVVTRLGDEIAIIAEARSFLHHQVRNMVGTLAEVGYGRRPASWPRAVLLGADRAKAGQTAPPEGLVLTGVRYPEAVGWV
jgi:tRNA pseudouridine38-40 synthase